MTRRDGTRVRTGSAVLALTRSRRGADSDLRMRQRAGGRVGPTATRPGHADSEITPTRISRRLGFHADSDTTPTQKSHRLEYCADLEITPTRISLNCKSRRLEYRTDSDIRFSGRRGYDCCIGSDPDHHGHPSDSDRLDRSAGQCKEDFINSIIIIVSSGSSILF